MALSVVYTVVKGEVLSENRGGVKRDYMPDTLGSTVALLDDTQTKTDTWTYWPYGEVKTRTGTNTTPFTYVGTLGYFKDELTRLYVRARYLRVELAQWLTVDPIWPAMRAFTYADGNPVHMTDPTGLACVHWRIQWGYFNRSSWDYLACVDIVTDLLFGCIPVPSTCIYGHSRFYVAAEDQPNWTQGSTSACAVFCASACKGKPVNCTLLCIAGCGAAGQWLLRCTKVSPGVRGDSCVEFIRKPCNGKSIARCCPGMGGRGIADM